MTTQAHPPLYRWVIVAAGGLLGCVAIGAMFSLPVLLRPIAKDTGWSTTGISSAMTFAFLAMAIGSIGWGNLSDRIGQRPVVLIGSVILCLSLIATSMTTTLFGFQLIFGIFIGASTSAVFAPMMACVTGWFDTQRSLAVSLVSAGMGTAPMTMAPLAAWLVSRYDWRTTLLLLAGVAAGLMLPAAALVRRAPTLAEQINHSTPEAAPGTSLSIKQVLRSPAFMILMATNFLCCATHSGPIFHTVSYATTCGISLVAAVTIYSVEGIAGLFGRVAFGFLGDRFGAKRILVLGLLAQALAALAYLSAGSLHTFYSVAALFGFIYSGVMPLYSVIARENFPLRMMGTVIGGLAMAGSFGMALGPVAGGFIFDAVGSYSWLFIGCFALGMGAFLISLTIRPLKLGGASLAGAAVA